MSAEHHITRLGLKGDGVAEGPIYAARTLPGETVTGEIEEGRIAAPRILTPSPDRVKPLCAHYKACGGCQLMHASDAFVATWKQDVVRQALSAQGLDAEIDTIVTSPPSSRRRATLHGRRLKSGPVVGFHGARSDTVTAIPDCHVLSPGILAAIPALEEITGIAGSRKGRLSFALTETETGLDCAVTGGPPLDRKLAQDLPKFASAFARLTWGDELVFADPLPRLPIGPADLTPPPGAFLQATRAGQDALTEAVLAAIGPAQQVADLFAGCGTFALPISARAAVHAVEAEVQLLQALEKAAHHTQGLKTVTTETRDLFRNPLDAAELSRFDAVVIDPPRAGATAQIAELAQTEIPAIAMVSCNPVSFAKDMRVLDEAGYAMERLEVVDQFRWSTHVELVASLRRR